MAAQQRASGRRFRRDHVSRLHRSDGGIGVAFGGSVNKTKLAIGRVGQPAQIRQADAVINGIARANAAAAKRDHHIAKGGGINATDKTSGRRNGPDDRRGGEMLLRRLDQVRWPALGHDHAGENLGGTP